MPELSEVYPTDPKARPLFPWEEHAAFRASFLMHFTTEGHRAALEAVGQLLYDSALEAKNWPPWPESTTRAELRAAAADLRHTEAFLAAVGQEQYTVSLDTEDEQLSIMAREWSIMVGRIAQGIEWIVEPLRKASPIEPEE